MKKLILLTAITIFASMTAFAARSENVEVRMADQKTSALGKITVKFISVTEDSRCPQGTQCIWAGNAKVKVSLSKGKKAKTFELDSTRGNTVIQFQGYDIKFVDLRPQPGEMVKMVAKPKVLTVSIAKHA